MARLKQIAGPHIFWRKGRAHADLRSYEDVGGKREALAPPAPHGAPRTQRSRSGSSRPGSPSCKPSARTTLALQERRPRRASIWRSLVSRSKRKWATVARSWSIRSMVTLSAPRTAQKLWSTERRDTVSS